MERKLMIENHGEKRFLMYEIEDVDLDTLTLGMLTNNKIAGLAEVSFTQMDNRKLIRYDITSRVSVKELLEGIVNRKRLLGVLSGIIDAMMAADEYMINPETIVLNPNYIFSDPHSGETVLICMPVVEPDQDHMELKLFIKTLLFKIRYDQSEGNECVSKIVSYLNNCTVFAPADFREYLRKLEFSGGKPVKAGSGTAGGAKIPAGTAAVSGGGSSVRGGTGGSATGRSGAGSVGYAVPGGSGSRYNDNPGKEPDVTEEEEPISLFYLLQHYNKENAARYKAQQEKKKAQNGKSTKKDQKEKKREKASVGFAVPGQKDDYAHMDDPAPVNPSENLSGGGAVQGEHIDFGATTMLDEVPSYPYLIREKNNAQISINKPVFCIGKSRAQTDYCIEDNPAVSRLHARIISRNGVYYVVDLQSTNHTTVRQSKIAPNEEVQLNHGDQVIFANEHFEFREY